MGLGRTWVAHLSLPPGPFPPRREVVPLEVSLETLGSPGHGYFLAALLPLPHNPGQVPEGPLCPPAPSPRPLMSWVLPGGFTGGEGGRERTHRCRTCRGWMPLAMRSDTMRTWALFFGS